MGPQSLQAGGPAFLQHAPVAATAFLQHLDSDSLPGFKAAWGAAFAACRHTSSPDAPKFSCCPPSAHRPRIHPRLGRPRPAPQPPNRSQTQAAAAMTVAQPPAEGTYQPRSILVTGGAGEEGRRRANSELGRPHCSNSLVPPPPCRIAGFIASWVVIKLVQQQPQTKVRAASGGAAPTAASQAAKSL